jgi:hypothetical protein
MTQPCCRVTEHLAAVLAGAHVLVLGRCGVLLGMLAALAGAGHVTVIERSRQQYLQSRALLLANLPAHPQLAVLDLVPCELEGCRVAGEAEAGRPAGSAAGTGADEAVGAAGNGEATASPLAGLAPDAAGGSGSSTEASHGPAVPGQSHSSDASSSSSSAAAAAVLHELPSRAGVLVTDLFDHSVLGAGVLGKLRYAAQHLLHPGCRVLPEGVQLWGCLLERRVDQVEGFDLSPLNRYRWHPQLAPVDLTTCLAATASDDGYQVQLQQEDGTASSRAAGCSSRAAGGSGSGSSKEGAGSGASRQKGQAADGSKQPGQKQEQQEEQDVPAGDSARPLSAGDSARPLSAPFKALHVDLQRYVNVHCFAANMAGTAAAAAAAAPPPAPVPAPPASAASGQHQSNQAAVLAPDADEQQHEEQTQGSTTGLGSTAGAAGGAGTAVLPETTYLQLETIDVDVQREGAANGVALWFELHMHEGSKLAAGYAWPGPAAAGSSSAAHVSRGPGAEQRGQEVLMAGAGARSDPEAQQGAGSSGAVQQEQEQQEQRPAGEQQGRCSAAPPGLCSSVQQALRYLQEVAVRRGDVVRVGGWCGAGESDSAAPLSRCTATLSGCEALLQCLDCCVPRAAL